MAQASGPEDEIRALIQEAQEERQKLQRRILSAQRAIEAIDQKLAAFQVTLNALLDRYGLERDRPTVFVDPALAAEFRGMAPKEMLLRWAEQHGGEVVMNEACKFLAAAGLFTDDRQAAGTLFSTIKRMPDFERVDRGVYRKRPKRAAGMYARQLPASLSDDTPRGAVVSSFPAAEGHQEDRVVQTEAGDEAQDLDADDLPF